MSQAKYNSVFLLSLEALGNVVWAEGLDDGFREKQNLQKKDDVPPPPPLPSLTSGFHSKAHSHSFFKGY